jgi:hypothetical protein
LRRSISRRIVKFLRLAKMAWRRRFATTIWLASGVLFAQDLTPRAYLITPRGSNAILLAYSYSSGSVFADASLPIEDFTARFHTQIFSYVRAFSFAGRSANVAASLPYVAGNFRAIVAGNEAGLSRSGLADARVRVSVNIKGGPAMDAKEFRDWREKSVLGASLTFAVPSGQYDGARVINNSTHRWGVKPELGFSRRFGRWTVDLYGGAWLFTANSEFYPGASRRSQAPIGAGEAHLVRYLTPRCWLSLDMNYWNGGRTSVNGNEKRDRQSNSRIGATVAVPVNRHQSVKFSYSTGAYVLRGGDYTTLSVAWQYSWIGGFL